MRRQTLLFILLSPLLMRPARDWHMQVHCDVLMLALLLMAGSISCSAPWQAMNNTNLRFGDLKALDFMLPAGTGDEAGVRACESFCENHTECAAFVFVRESRNGSYTPNCTPNRPTPAPQRSEQHSSSSAESV